MLKPIRVCSQCYVLFRLVFSIACHILQGIIDDRPGSHRAQSRSTDYTTGLFKAGKTRFIQSVSQYTEWPGQNWFFGRVRVDEQLLLHFLEPPNDQPFDFMWVREMISKLDVTGYIVLMDSTQPKFFGEFLSILYTVRGMHPDTPCVVAANKQDHPRAWRANDIRLGLGITDDIPVLPCQAHDRDMVKDVVVELLYRILDVG